VRIRAFRFTPTAVFVREETPTFRSRKVRVLAFTPTAVLVCEVTLGLWRYDRAVVEMFDCVRTVPPDLTEAERVFVVCVRAFDFLVVLMSSPCAVSAKAIIATLIEYKNFFIFPSIT
jgi:hypothetical protein